VAVAVLLVEEPSATASAHPLALLDGLVDRDLWAARVQITDHALRVSLVCHEVLGLVAAKSGLLADGALSMAVALASTGDGRRVKPADLVAVAVLLVEEPSATASAHPLALLDGLVDRDLWAARVQITDHALRVSLVCHEVLGLVAGESAAGPCHCRRSSLHLFGCLLLDFVCCSRCLFFARV